MIFIITIICILSPYTFASSPPQIPQILPSSQASTSRTPRPTGPMQHEHQPGYEPRKCVDWIRHYGFKNVLNDNKQLELEEGFRVNYGISLWAAGFAYGLFQNAYYFDSSFYIPWLFCERHVFNDALYPFVSLQEAEFTCEGWIHFYGYNHKVHHSLNLHWINNRDQLMDPHISFWAASYFNYITSNSTRNRITSAEFCYGMGQTVVTLPDAYPFMKIDGLKMSCLEPWNFYHLLDDLRVVENALPRSKFITVKNTYISCREWIYQYGYIENIDFNVHKVIHRDRSFDGYVAYCTRRYFNYIENIIDTGEGTFRTPTYYCSNSHMPSTIKINYFGRTQIQQQNRDLL